MSERVGAHQVIQSSNDEIIYGCFAWPAHRDTTHLFTSELAAATQVQAFEDGSVGVRNEQIA